MIEKTASVHWEGQGKKGLGKISTETGALKHYPYGFASRFEGRQGPTEEIPARAFFFRRGGKGGWGKGKEGRGRGRG